MGHLEVKTLAQPNTPCVRVCGCVYTHHFLKKNILYRHSINYLEFTYVSILTPNDFSLYLNKNKLFANEM